jgi:abortive infection bacteriophage resistance protein
VKYTKAPLTFEQQADLLIARGLLADKTVLVTRLHEVNYYRLSAYWHPFRTPDTENLQSGTKWETVWRRYTFDRQLRLLVMDAIERVEVSTRTRIVNAFTLQHGPFGHTDGANLPGISPFAHREFMERLHVEQRRSKENFVRHFHEKYTSETELPLWMACELMPFGMTLTLYQHLDKHIQVGIADAYHIPPKVLETWMRTLNYVRNICAHHGRLWNRELAIRPFIPRQHTNSAWHVPVDIAAAQHRLFSVLTLLRYMMAIIAPQSQWSHRFDALLAQYHDIPLPQMGFPSNWRECPIWAQSSAGELP